RLATLPHPLPVLSAVFSPDGKAVLTGCGERGRRGQARLWDAVTGAPLGPALVRPEVVSCAWVRPDGGAFFAPGPAECQLVETATLRPIGRPVKHDGGEIACACYSPDGKRLLTLGADGTARLTDTATAEPVGPKLAPVKGPESHMGQKLSEEGRA